jgi:hypothetical protein
VGVLLEHVGRSAPRPTVRGVQAFPERAVRTNSLDGTTQLCDVTQRQSYRGDIVKKTYEKPALNKAARLQQIAAATVVISGVVVVTPPPIVP